MAPIHRRCALPGNALLRRFDEALPAPLAEMVAALKAAAAQAEMSLYLVGGAVRDLLLGWPLTDVDLVVEGDAVALAHQAAPGLGATVAAHPRFGTATLKKEGLRLDLASARAESYPHPGALPHVRRGKLADDLARRDFTINTLALGLAGPQQGKIVDPFGGQADLAQGWVRVLHSTSFRDDPTRMLRAVRCEVRLGFRLEATTEALVRRDGHMLASVSGDRLRRGLELLLHEREPEVALTRLGQLMLLAQLHPQLAADPWLALRFHIARDAASRRSISEAPPYYALMAYRLEMVQAEEFLDRLNLPGQAARVMRHTQRLKAHLAEFNEEMPPSRLARHLAPFDPEAVLAVALAMPDPYLARRFLSYLTDLRYRKLTFTGNDLVALGVAPGPGLGRCKARLQDAYWDGVVNDKEEEEALVRHWVEAHRETAW